MLCGNCLRKRKFGLVLCQTATIVPRAKGKGSPLQTAPLARRLLHIAHASFARRTEWYPRSFVAAHPNAIYCPTSHDGVELANNPEPEKQEHLHRIRQTNPPSRAGAFLMHCWDASSAEELPRTSKQPI